MRQRYVERAPCAADSSATSIATVRMVRMRLCADGRLSGADELFQSTAGILAITATVAIATVAITVAIVGSSR